MGYGDDIMASGMARGLKAAKGRRAAFGDGRRIIWGPWSQEILKGNPNVAPPGSEGDSDLYWIAHYKGNRAYNQMGGEGWIWNYNFRPTPGEFFFDDAERALTEAVRREFGPFVLIEPNAPVKSIAPNKQWKQARWDRVGAALMERGIK